MLLEIMRLYTYCIPYDDGAAPNPFFGVCTLVICKPVIRRTACIGDWIVGTGSKNVDGVDYSNKVVYAMKVTQKMTMMEYDSFTQNHLMDKVPDWDSISPERRVGDSIYNFSSEPPWMRLSVHGIGNRDTDIGGKFALLSDHFYYFGRDAKLLEGNLLGIVRQGQGHRVNKNEPFKDDFVRWIENPRSKIYFNDNSHKPQIWPEEVVSTPTWCGQCRAEEGAKDEESEND